MPDLMAVLVEFEVEVGRAFPGVMDRMRPGATPAETEGLLRALHPWVPSEDVLDLYRWHNGGPVGVFGGWRLQSIDQALEDRTRDLAWRSAAPAWFPLFDNQIVSIAELTLDRPAPSTPIWYGHTHDQWLLKLFDNVCGLVLTCLDALRAKRLQYTDGFHEGLRLEPTASLDGRDFDEFRLPRNPQSFSYSRFRVDQPQRGRERNRFLEDSWPEHWKIDAPRP